ncbi:HAD family hydrolase [Prochlorococcus marinus]|uniref:HAD family hydrolase n=1 Tax=Prochlorococcus marinus TaxID=1219 RepID=UPI0022B5A5D1|nr:HAD family phosphatase [Prochlorococcus marinus]
MSKNIKAIIFDMDGVLIDAKEWHYDALNQALEIFGEKIERSEHLSSFDGLPTRSKLDLLSKSGRIPIHLHEFINELKQAFTMEITAVRCKPRFIHQYALSMLKLDGYKLALASNSVIKTINTMMELASLSEYLEFSLSNEDVNDPKPSPEIYIKALGKLNLNAKEVVVVEDNKNGIEAAKAAGTNVLEVESTNEVTYNNIKKFIMNLEKK